MDNAKAALGVLIISAALFWAFQTCFHFVEVQFWPKSDAIGTESSVLLRGSGRNSVWVGTVGYSYKVNGRSYEGQEQIASAFPWESERFSADFPATSHFFVHYNPANAAESSLGWWLRPLLLFLIIGPTALIVGYYALPVFFQGKSAQNYR